MWPLSSSEGDLTQGGGCDGLLDGVLLAGAARLGSVPGVIIQGTMDLVNLVGTPWQLAAAWPGSQLVLIDDAGHGGNAALISAIIAATGRFARAAGTGR